jgi:undecaprenyl-diphosphatase
VAFLPAVVFGLAFGSFIKEKLFHPVPVATAFLVGCLIILWVEARHKRAFGERDLEGQRHARVETVDDMTVVDALKVGLVQCLAMIPGTSRSGATIIGGMLFGLSRRAATEFSFYLAIPTLIGAGVYSLWKQRGLLTAADLPLFAVGLVFAFFSAWLCIRWLIRYISTHDFTVFAWYRIAFGVAVLATAYFGWVDWSHG